MIRINLLPARKKVTRQSRGEQSVLIGVGIIAALAVIVYFAVHRPMAADLEAQQEENAGLTKKNKEIEDQIKELGSLRSAIKAAQEQRAAIERLNQARAVPAWFLYELASLLTRGGSPSITENMARVLESNPNRKWQPSWDPKHVWITKINENNGQFSLEGGAQSDSDVTQLALRLQASMFFDEVQPASATIAVDKESSVSYYSFQITGKVRY